MNNPHDLTKALAKNGAYDHEKAAEQKTRLVGNYRAKMRKVERMFWGYMCFCAWMGVFAGLHFMHSSATKALLFYGLLTLVFFETTILMKLWYWTANNKISVLKAIKQLELGRSPDVDVHLIPEDSEEPVPFVEGLARWERRAWTTAVVGGCFLLVFVKGLETQGVEGPVSPFSGEGSLTSAGYLMLAADGSGLEKTEISFVNTRTSRTSSFTFHAPQAVAVRFADSNGQELPIESASQSESQSEHVRYVVRLLRPAMSGQRVSYIRTQENAAWATEEEGVWTHSADFGYVYNTNELAQTVVLPEGAELVAAEPWPVAKLTLNKRTAVRFEATRGQNDRFHYTVQYRLAPVDPSN